MIIRYVDYPELVDLIDRARNQFHSSPTERCPTPNVVIPDEGTIRTLLIPGSSTSHRNDEVRESESLFRPISTPISKPGLNVDWRSQMIEGPPSPGFSVDSSVERDYEAVQAERRKAFVEVLSRQPVDYSRLSRRDAYEEQTSSDRQEMPRTESSSTPVLDEPTAQHPNSENDQAVAVSNSNRWEGDEELEEWKRRNPHLCPYPYRTASVNPDRSPIQDEGHCIRRMFEGTLFSPRLGSLPTHTQLRREREARNDGETSPWNGSWTFPASSSSSSPSPSNQRSRSPINQARRDFSRDSREENVQPNVERRPRIQLRMRRRELPPTHFRFNVREHLTRSELNQVINYHQLLGNNGHFHDGDELMTDNSLRR